MEVMDTMTWRWISFMCIQEIKWVGEKAKKKIIVRDLSFGTRVKLDP